MPALHHVAIAPEDVDAWAALAAALAPDDVVVFLDRAAQALQCAGAAAVSLPGGHAGGVRWLLPAAERVDGAPVPAAVEVIDERQWLELIAAHPLLLDWS